jgi:hypothetical protein
MQALARRHSARTQVGGGRAHAIHAWPWTTRPACPPRGQRQAASSYSVHSCLQVAGAGCRRTGAQARGWMTSAPHETPGPAVIIAQHAGLPPAAPQVPSPRPPASQNRIPVSALPQISARP